MNWLDDAIPELWKALKSLGLANKTSVCGENALKINSTMSFNTKSTIDVFKNYHSTLPVNLLKKLPTSPSKYTFHSVIQCYRHFIQSDAFNLTYTGEIYIKKIFRSTNANISKAAGINELLPHFPMKWFASSFKTYQWTV